MIKHLTKEEYVKLSGDLGIHPLQSESWIELKSYNWEAIRFLYKSGEIQKIGMILTRKLPVVGKSFGYAPRLEVDVSDKNFLDEFRSFCKDQKLGFILVDPDVYYGNYSEDQTGQIEAYFQNKGFLKNGKQIQPSRTVVLDLRKTEEELMSDMRSKHRQYIRKAEKNGARITQAGEEFLEQFCSIVKEIAIEKTYVMHDADYYKNIYKLFSSTGNAFLLKASLGDDVVGGYLLLTSKDIVYEMYGGCNKIGNDKLASYLLKWESIKLFKSKGLKFYDQWGAEFIYPGLVQFKEGFGGQVINFPQQFVYVFDKISFWAYKLASRIRVKR